MKLLITGSRTFEDKKHLYDELSKIDFDLLISGGAAGADQLAEEYARDNDIQIEQHKPDYNKYGRGAPIVRNKEMVDLCDLVIAFWDKKSRGTKSTIEYAAKNGKKLIVCYYE